MSQCIHLITRLDGRSCFGELCATQTSFLKEKRKNAQRSRTQLLTRPIVNFGFALRDVGGRCNSRAGANVPKLKAVPSAGNTVCTDLQNGTLALDTERRPSRGE
jgi:hypothetical protein